MSNLENDRWLEAAQENFREAISQKKWGMAKAVVEDVREAGFTGESTEMEKEIYSQMRSAPHGYILGFLRKKNEEYKAKGLVPTLDMLIEDLTG